MKSAVALVFLIALMLEPAARAQLAAEAPITANPVLAPIETRDL
jgi:hypothetical protein